jgi:hypothetical protein
MSNETQSQNQNQKPKEAPKAAPAPEAAFPQFPQFPQFASFDPTTFWTQSQQAFQKIITDSYARAHSFAEQYAALETQVVSRAQGAVANWAQLAQDAITYSATLSAEARKLGFETARKMSVGA